MNKIERRELLQLMLRVNEKISDSNPAHAIAYARYLIDLCSQPEYKNAEIIRCYTVAEEHARLASEEYYSHILNLTRPDDRALKLEAVMENLEAKEEKLYDSYQEALNYFHEIENEHDKSFDLPLEA